MEDVRQQLLDRKEMEAKSLSDLLSLYQKLAAAENKSPRTIETVTEAVRQFDRFLGGRPDVSLITAEDLRSHIRALQQQEKWADHPAIKGHHGRLSPHSIASKVRSIKAFFSNLEKAGFIKDNPLATVQTPKTPRKLVKALTPEQVDRLCAVIPRNNHAGYRDLAIIVALYGTGLRISELLGLSLDDIDFDTGEIRVMGKGAKERSVFMSPNVFKALFMYVHRWRPNVVASYLFVHADGRPLNRFHMAHRLHRHAKVAGLSSVRCSPHAFRHSFAIEYLRSGGDVFTLQRILGHSSLDMTRRYAGIADRDIEVKMKAISPAETLRLSL